MSATDSGVRRHAFSLPEALRKFLAATAASVWSVMPWSCM